MPMPSPLSERVAEAIALGHRGNRARARWLLAAAWAEVGDGGDALHRCAVAHAMADVQDDPRDVLVWDERALAAAGAITDARLAQAGAAASVRDLYPSLHLNLADAHHRTGDARAAREHLTRGRAALAALGCDPYGGMLTDAFAALDQRLRESA